jgi:DNA replication protein DnaC
MYPQTVEKTFHCQKHGHYRCTVSEIPFMQSFTPPCPICDNEKLAQEEQEQEKEEKKFLEELEKKELRKMNIGEKFWKESFKTFDAYSEELKTHLETCINFVKNPAGRMLVMLGNNGNGKDHLASSALKEINGCMYSVFELELLLRQSYTGHTSEWDIYEKLCEVSLLVINEIGKHKPGEWELNFISYIINKRYENMKPVILISNTHLKENCPQKGCDKCLENYIGNDVISRIIEGGEIMLFTGTDYRIKKREMAIKRRLLNE